MRAGSGMVATILLTLAVASASAGADIHKCRQGARLIYQEAPCPADSQALPAPALPPRPSAYAEAEARLRASNDIAAAAAFKQHEHKAAEASARRAAAEARKRGSDCDLLRGRIERAEAKVKPGKREKTALKQDRRDYREDCATY